MSPRRRGRELVKRRTFATRDQARLALFRYIESFYNPLRRHSSLEMRRPDEYEHRYWEDNAAAAAPKRLCQRKRGNLRDRCVGSADKELLIRVDREAWRANSYFHERGS